MARPIITLTTDFGGGSHYVAAMKGAILAINPEATIVDISHEIWPQDVRTGGWILATTAPNFPPGTIHVGVVDPGVGTDRAIVIADIDGQRFVAPDNGLLGLVAKRHQPRRVYRVTNPEYMNHDGLSRTFHGRDVMSPVAAHLSLGVPFDEFGPMHSDLRTLPWNEPNRSENSVEGEVVFVDTFGNLITNIHQEMLGKPLPKGAYQALFGKTKVQWVETYGQARADTAVALIGSGGYLEVAVVQGDASQALDGGVGAKVTVRW